ncbi:TrmO family methyltransferase domain-containing protein [Anaeromicropila herbilytica]|uniref:UvrABC system protein A n=1 Tax=Anaeromicropila herbilytica TaxID=2785025 RepID=A0A7R7IEI9_9FIRM|nr:TrmO family methyltransferase [Anaeromicropila herbilytica]BCN32692.1 hypothetical protein bsdtb5_39870 [Anaeromicropila herbilytica]
MYHLNTIGTMQHEDGNTCITIKKDYRKALKYLDKFSHIHIFYTSLENSIWRLQTRIANIQTVDIKKGVILTEALLKNVDKLDVIDIKPYFPCEDSVKGTDQNVISNDITSLKNQIRPNGANIEIIKVDDLNSYLVEQKGTIRNTQGEVYIQLTDKMDITSNYIKILWWFHKFDSEIYRKVTECNPPYENSPRTGVFATRSPVRPNPLAMTVARILKVDHEQNRIYINAIESFDKTPCIGILEYRQDSNCILECRVPEWLSHWPKWYDDKKMDEKECRVTCKDSGLVSLLNTNIKNNIKYSIKNRDDIKIPTVSSKKKKNDSIYILGARENNLKGIDVRIPYGKITAVVGVSGSGKSSLVHDTIYAECRRRMEYLNNNRNMLQKPKVENMTGCIPAVLISQNEIRGNSQSTVGTYTNAYDYLRMIYASVAVRHCPDCGNEIIPLTKENILNLLSGIKDVEIFDLMKQTIEEETLERKVNLALERGKGAFYIQLPDHEFILLQTKQKCYRCDKLMFEMTPRTFSYIDSESRCPICNGTGENVEIDEKKIIEHPEVSLLDGASSFYGKLRDFLASPNANWMKGQVFGLAHKMGEDLEKPWNELSHNFRDKILHGSGDEIVTFSYDNKKLGRKGEITRPVEGICNIIKRIYDDNTDTKTINQYMSKVSCKHCNGERLNKEGRMATIGELRYPTAAAMTFDEVIGFCDQLVTVISINDYKKINHAIQSLKEVAESARRLGLGYIQMSQETSTLSGGERQRVKLLAAMLNHMTGILYVFDEPSKGLHPKDYAKVTDMIQYLKDEGNTIIMVEHNDDMIRTADYIIEIGPGAGEQGGLLVGEGSYEVMINNKDTQISRYLNSEVIKKAPYMKKNQNDLSFITMKQLKYRNLKNITIQFPKKAFTCINGVSGSGKSSLMKGEIYQKANHENDFSEVILVDQLPIGKTSKSVIATYIGVMDDIREAMALSSQAIEYGFDEKYFSFNGELGQCVACKGEGRVRIKYLEDSYMECLECSGKRYQKKILGVEYHDKSIDDILNMSIDEALHFWSEVSDITQKLEIVKKVGLGYLKIGQSTPTLSGGEASRLKLAKQLMSTRKKNVLYLLDEPTTGLHYSDIEHLLGLISELIENGNTVIAIEHNKQFVQNCDWIIELGPGAGKDGGQVISQGTF